MNQIIAVITVIIVMTACREVDDGFPGFDDTMPVIVTVQPNNVTDVGSLVPMSEYHVAASYHFVDGDGELYDGLPVFFWEARLEERTSLQVVIGQTPPNQNIRALQIWRTVSNGERFYLDTYVELLPVDGIASYFLIVGDDELRLRREL